MKQSPLGITSMVLGIISILTACIAFGIVPGIIGLILAIIALCQKDRKHEQLSQVLCVLLSEL